jgi:hypothetical protein
MTFHTNDRLTGMPSESERGLRWPEPLGQRLPADADAGQVADAVASIWRDIDQALHPIVGHRGVLALYNRSLALASVHHPWLAAGHLGALAAIDASALRAALVQQPPAEAAAGGSALLQRFRELLSSLIGASLTDRLLRPVWAPTPGASPLEDASPP